MAQIHVERSSRIRWWWWVIWAIILAIVAFFIWVWGWGPRPDRAVNTTHAAIPATTPRVTNIRTIVRAPGRAEVQRITVEASKVDLLQA